MSELVQLFIELGAYQEGDFVLSSGQKSNYYVDCKKATLDSRALQIIVDDISSYCMFNDIIYDCVGGMSTGADPIIGGMLQIARLRTKGFYVRKSHKEHGMCNQVEGHVYGDILLVEDVTTTGRSLANVIDLIKSNYGKNIVGAISVVDRMEGAKAFLLEKYGVCLHSLLTVDDLRRTLQ